MTPAHLRGIGPWKKKGLWNMGKETYALRVICLGIIVQFQKLKKIFLFFWTLTKRGLIDVVYYWNVGS